VASIGEQIKSFRIKNNLTQKDLADKLNVTPQAVSRWEQDVVEPGIGTLKQMSLIFSISLDELLHNELPETQPESEPINTYQEIDHRRTIGVCEQCNRAILEGEKLHRVDTYKRQHIYCDSCKIDVDNKKRKRQTLDASTQRRKGYLFGLLAGGAFFGISLAIQSNLVLTIPDYAYVLIIVALTYAVMAFIFCVFAQNNFVGHLFFSIAVFGIVRMPGVIFTLDFGGLLFLVGVKILFGVIAFLIGATVSFFAFVVSAFFAIFVFPYAVYNSYKYPEKTTF
jgi:transcriptional regulator with XRE-family HTH domain